MLSERKSARTEFAWRDCAKKPQKRLTRKKPGRAAGLCGVCFSFSCSECLAQGGRPDTMSQSKRKAWDATMQASGHAPTRKTTKRASGDLSSNLRATAKLVYFTMLSCVPLPARVVHHSRARETQTHASVLLPCPLVLLRHTEKKSWSACSQTCVNSRVYRVPRHPARPRLPLD